MLNCVSAMRFQNIDMDMPFHMSVELDDAFILE